MPRKLSEAQAHEYTELRAFLHLYFTEVKQVAVDSPVHPSKVLDRIANRYGQSKALTGLKQAIGDTIEETQRLKPARVAELDHYFHDRGVVTLSKLRSRYWSKYQSTLKRGRIRSDTEYYLVVGVLNDLSAPTAEGERAKLQALITSYEERQA